MDDELTLLTHLGGTFKVKKSTRGFSVYESKDGHLYLIDASGYVLRAKASDDALRPLCISPKEN